jgi:hypothetical protein
LYQDCSLTSVRSQNDLKVPRKLIHVTNISIRGARQAEGLGAAVRHSQHARAHTESCLNHFLMSFFRVQPTQFFFFKTWVHPTEPNFFPKFEFSWLKPNFFLPPNFGYFFCTSCFEFSRLNSTFFPKSSFPGSSFYG